MVRYVVRYYLHLLIKHFLDHLDLTRRSGWVPTMDAKGSRLVIHWKALIKCFSYNGNNRRTTITIQEDTYLSKQVWCPLKSRF